MPHFSSVFGAVGRSIHVVVAIGCSIHVFSPYQISVVVALGSPYEISVALVGAIGGPE